MSYRANGQSTGVCTVEFQRADDAGRAYTQYNNRLIDGSKYSASRIANERRGTWSRPSHTDFSLDCRKQRSLSRSKLWWTPPRWQLRPLLGPREPRELLLELPRAREDVLLQVHLHVDVVADVVERSAKLVRRSRWRTLTPRWRTTTSRPRLTLPPLPRPSLALAEPDSIDRSRWFPSPTTTYGSIECSAASETSPFKSISGFSCSPLVCRMS